MFWTLAERGLFLRRTARDRHPEDGWVTVATPEAAQAAQEAAQATPEQWLTQLGKRRRSRAKSAAAHRVFPDQLPLR